MRDRSLIFDEQMAKKLKNPSLSLSPMLCYNISCLLINCWYIIPSLKSPIPMLNIYSNEVNNEMNTSNDSGQKQSVLHRYTWTLISTQTFHAEVILSGPSNDTAQEQSVLHRFTWTLISIQTFHAEVILSYPSNDKWQEQKELYKFPYNVA